MKASFIGLLLLHLLIQTTKATKYTYSTQHLSIFPQDIPLNATKLDFQNNWLVKITDDDFKNFTNLTVLDFEQNMINNISLHAFDNNIHLTSLSFSYNPIVIFPYFMLDPIKFLAFP